MLLMMMIIMMMMAIMMRMIMVMMMRVLPQFSAFLLVATRSLASRGAWFSGSACVGRGSPNGLASSRAGRAWLHGLHAHWVGGGLEQEGLERPLLVPGERHRLGRGHHAGSIWRRRSNYRGTTAMKPRKWPAASQAPCAS